ncbi:MAG: hypothetical protein LBN74_00015 [Prevotella sp.]|jgi:hypothetical protein|nr:hypothetical protein [Prevotella sp.]
MKNILNELKKKESIFYIVCFSILFLSFFTNVFQIIPENRYKEHETFEEALVVGKMAKAQKDGTFAASGFTGVNYDKALVADSILRGDQINDLLIRDHIISQFRFEQIKYYTGEEKTPEDYCVYVSHSGGNALFWYAIQKALPFDNSTNYQILRLINCILLSLCFMLIIGWGYRNFGFIAALVTFLFTFLSSWLVLFGGNGLWWALWNFYAPFLVMLLLLEKRHNSPDTVSVKKILIWLFAAVLVKLFFSGLEFISTALLTIFIPIIYYAIVEGADQKGFSRLFYSYTYRRPNSNIRFSETNVQLFNQPLEKWKIIDFIKLSIKSGLVAGGALIIQFGALIIQLRYLLGNYDSAFLYLSNAFIRRASFKSGLSGADLDTERFADSDSLSFLWNNVIKDYLRGNAFEWGFVSLGFEFWYAVLIGIILFFGVIVFFLNRKRSDIKYDALLVTTILSAVCPLSWFVIFKEHAFWHPQIDFIVWYMPSLLLGFAVIGVGISMLLSKRINPDS